DLIEGNRLGCVLQLEQSAQRRQVKVLIVDERGVFLEDRVLAAPRRMLKLEHGVGVEEMVLAVAPPLVLTAPRQIVFANRTRWKRLFVSSTHFFRDHIDANAADARRG